MRVNLVIRTVATMLAAAALVHSDAAIAIARLPMCWIDAKTGKPVETYPQGTKAGLDPYHRSRPTVGDVPGKDFVKSPGGSWIDAKTGKTVQTYPQGTTAGLDPYHRSRPTVGDVPGKDFVLVPCLPSPKPTLHSSVPLKGKSDAPITLGSHISIGIGTGGSDTQDDSQPGFVVFGQ